MDELIREYLEYNPTTGVLIWKLDRGKKVKAGDLAGTDNGIGYLAVKLDGKSFKVHRVAWFLKTGSWPTGVIDHINHVRSDNRWDNLRETTVKGNNFNKGLAKNNISGSTGVRFIPSNKKWRACIKANKKSHHLGYFTSKEDAEKAYLDAKTRLHSQE